MQQFDAAAVRIILVFARRFGLAVALMLAASGVARAQGGYSLRMELDYQSGLFTVPPTTITTASRSEVNVSPVGAIRVYVRAISLPGVDGQVLLDVQVYEPRGGSEQAQIASFTMPAYLGTQNSADMTTIKGKLGVRAYVDLTGAGGGVVAPGSSSSLPPAAPPPQPVRTPVDMGEPVRPQALPAPLPSPLPRPGG